MNQTEKHLLDTLQSIEGNGAFVTAGIKNFTFPGLNIDGLGEVGFPVNTDRALEMIRFAHKAPFGKGRKTITDTKVRSAWEIDANQLSLKYTDWENFMADILQEVKAGFDIEAQTITASLYKLLIYEKGDFFLPHKDSEKEKGMFGTLVIGLPSTHTGGELVVQFDEREETIDFSVPASNYKIPYAAFFADCDHEIKPLISGYRVCLVYNLVQSAGEGNIASPQFKKQVDQMAVILESLQNMDTNWPKIVLLEHQYTPANFSPASLKRHDKPRADALLIAARQKGYFVGMGLVTHYLLGELVGDYYDEYSSRRYGRRSRPPVEAPPATMGEVHEATTTIEHWHMEGIPDMGMLILHEEDLLSTVVIGAGAPIEKEEEGYTGNAGMTMQYWYHYGAVIFWPHDKHAEVLSGVNLTVRLEWLEFYHQNWKNTVLQPEKNIRHILQSMAIMPLSAPFSSQLDFSPVPAVLLQLNDPKIFSTTLQPLLGAIFCHIPAALWVKLILHFPAQIFTPLFQKTAEKGEIEEIDHLLSILVALSPQKSPRTNAFLQEQINNIPRYLDAARVTVVHLPGFYARTGEKLRWHVSIAILEKVLLLSAAKTTDDTWVQKVVMASTRQISRHYINYVLGAVLSNLSPYPKGNPLADELRKDCILDLKDRTAVKPMPPQDWQREVPNTDQYPKIWAILRPFLESPTQQVLDYRQIEADRKQMIQVIGSAAVDLKMETVKQGSPHILRLTKTQASYEQALQHWVDDVALLEVLEGKG